jgi:hypothetical protein
MLTPTLDADDVARTFRVLNKIERESVKALRSGLKKELKSTAKLIAGEYPTQPLLSGFRQSFGTWGWGAVSGSVRVTPGKSRKGAGRQSVVSLSMNYKNATPFVIDMIGRRPRDLGNYSSDRYKKTPYGQGMALYRNVHSRISGWPNGGRVFYKKFLQQRQTVISKSVDIINKWSEQVSREI